MASLKRDTDGFVLICLIIAAVVLAFMVDVKYAVCLSCLLLVGILFIKRPEIAIMIGLFLAWDVIPGREFLPIRGGLRPVFLLTLLLLAGIFVLQTRGRRDECLPKTPLNILILVFLALILSSVFVAHYGFSVPWLDTMKASCFWYSLFYYFIIVGIIKEARQINILVTFLIVFANICALMSFVQWISGSATPIIPHMFSVHQEGYTLRIIGVLTPVAIVWPIFFADIILNSPPIGRIVFYCFEFILFAIAFMVQMTRAFWVAIVLSLAAVLVAGATQKKKLAGLTGNVVVAAVLILFVVWAGVSVSGVRGTVFAPYIERAKTLVGLEQVLNVPTLHNRHLENMRASSLMKKYPLTGTGFGNDILSLRNVDYYGVHNNYYFIGGVMGYPGLIVYLLIVGFALLRSYRNYRRINDPYLASIFLGNSAFFLGRLVQGWSTGNIGGYLLAYFALVFGINEVIIHLNDRRSSRPAQPAVNQRSEIYPVSFRPKLRIQQ